MVAANPLSEQDLVEARQELAAGRPLTVWFTPAAVGVPANGSAKVISIDEVAEGDFIQVRPAGSRDTMFCSPSELTRTRPARKKVQRPAERAPEPIVPPEKSPEASAPAPQKPRVAPVSERTPSSAPPAPEKSPPPPAQEKSPPPPAPGGKAPDRPRSAGSRSATRPAEVTVTLNATAEGEWTVEVMIGKKRTVRPTPVQPGDVAKAARALPSAVAEAIDASLEAARQRQLERVERLSAELEAAQRALHELIS
jgi:hypothetical protein